MPNQRNARPVSGEIMTADRGCAVLPRPDPCFDLVDAEFETLGDSAAGKPERRASRPWRASPSRLAIGKQHVERPPFGTVPAGPVFWITGAAAVAFWISGGHVLVR